MRISGLKNGLRHAFTCFFELAVSVLVEIIQPPQETLIWKMPAG